MRSKELLQKKKIGMREQSLQAQKEKKSNKKVLPGSMCRGFSGRFSQLLLKPGMNNRAGFVRSPTDCLYSCCPYIVCLVCPPHVTH